MAKALRSLLVLLFVTVSCPMQAQQARFTESDASLFMSELEEAFNATSERKRGNAFIEQFSYFWNSPNTPAGLKTRVMETVNLLQERRGRPFPDYHLYLTTIQRFTENNHPTESFDNWQRAITVHLQNPRYPLRHLKELLTTTLNLIDRRELYSTRGVTWSARSPRFTWHYRDTLKLEVATTHLVCYNKNDSIEIFDTRGTLYPESGIWKGEGGKVTWEAGAFDADQVYARLTGYTIEMSKPYFEAEGVEFVNQQYFSKPLHGNLEHKVTRVQNPSACTYPRFNSAGEVFHIDNIHPGIHYRGGFSQHGAKIVGAGTHENPATLSVYRNNSLFITARSLNFSLRPDEILSSSTEITMLLDTGFIYHPGLVFKYMAADNELTLIRDGEGVSRSPFFDTYHNISIDSEVISWKLNENRMEMRMLRGAAENHAFFESLSYYREAFYNALQGMDAIHPLQGLKNFSDQIRRSRFTAKDYAGFLSLPENHVRQQILGLSFYGFVGYNTVTDSVELRDRLNDYLLFRLGKKDYDVIRFKSLTPGNQANAVLNLNDNKLAVNGVEAISICDHQNVTFFPGNQEVVLEHNRNFIFDGDIKAGMLDFFGKGFHFSYENFRIDMTRIDSVRMKVMTDETDYYGQPLLQTIGNTLANLSGYLQIDSAGNKSGRNEYSQFPLLVSNSNSRVYYNADNIQEGAYKDDSFFFEIQPFTIDSINRLTTSNIAFEGTLVSNIFPNLDNRLTVRDDFSLGFVKESPPEGYPIYDQQARFTNSIDLSNKGLTGKGTLEYLTSKSESDAFTFLPSEVMGQANLFTIDSTSQATSFPDVQGEYLFVSFKPDEESLTAQSQEVPFTMYQRETTFDGELNLMPSGLKAKGTLSMPAATLASSKMELAHHTVMADSSSFNLTGEEQIEGISFKTTNLISQLDFEQRQGRFTSRGTGSKVEFTENRYISYINEFSWDMDKQNIYMGAKGSKGNRFVSTHRKQDSLDFYAPLATYDVKTHTIEASEVENIRVADVNILLHDSIVRIRPNAEMAALDSATIVLNDSIHSFKNARVTIGGKYKYNAFGEYAFVNGNEDTCIINFHNIGPNKEGITAAEGNVLEKENFTLNNHFAYKGNIFFNAGDSLLTFEGGARMLHPCTQNAPKSYVRFKHAVDPSNVMIPIDDETQDYEYQDLYHNVFLSRDSVHVYSSFLEGRQAYNDVPLLSPKGYLTYNSNNRSFDVAEAAKLANPAAAGPLLQFHEEGCYVSGTGPMDLGMELEHVTLQTSGSVEHKRENDHVALSVLLGIDFFLDAKSVDMMTRALRASASPEAQTDSARLKSRLTEWTDPETAQKIGNVLQPATDELDLLPPERQYTLCFTDVEMEWDTPSKSYRINGKAQMGWIKNKAIARQVEVKGVLSHSRGGNTFEIHVKADPDTWFFFSYQNGMMQTRSSLNEYNTHVQALETDERKRSKGEDKSYVFILSPKSRMNLFMNKFGASGLAADDPDEVEGKSKL